MSARTDRLEILDRAIKAAQAELAMGKDPTDDLTDWLLEQEILRNHSDESYEESLGLKEEIQEPAQERTTIQKALHLADHLFQDVRLTDEQAMQLAGIYAQISISESITSYLEHRNRSHPLDD